MSILEKMRSGTDSTAMQLLLAAVVVSFVAWYGQPKGNQGAIVARVNGHAIQDTTYGRAYRNAEYSRERALDRSLSDDESAALKEQVIRELVEQEVEKQQAADLGIEVSDKEIAKEILKNPNFKNEQGQFDQTLYQNNLRRMGFTEADYEDEQRAELLRDKLRRTVYHAATVSDAALEEAFVDAQTRIDVSYVRVAPLRFGDEVDVSDDAVAKYVADNKDKIHEQYQQDFERLYDIPEKVDLRVIRLAVRDDGVTPDQLKARLDDIKKQLDAGADFGDLAKRWSEHPTATSGGDLGEEAVTDLDDSLKNAVAKLEVGQTSDVVVDSDQLRLVKLEKRDAAHQIAEADVQNDIAKRLMRDEQSPKLAKEYANQLLAAWKDKKAPPQDLLDKEQLTVEDTGPIPPNLQGGGRLPPSSMLKAAKDLHDGDVLPEVYEDNGTYYVGVLTHRQDPDMSLYASQKDRIRDDVLLARRAQFYQDWLADAVARASVERQ